MGATKYFIKEVWEDIPGYEGKYHVSSMGRIRSISMAQRGAVKKQHISNNGRYMIRLSKDGVGKSFNVARIVALVFVENPYKKPYVNHIDGNKQNNEHSNLEWVTSDENYEHAKNKGLFLKGEKVKISKLTEIEVLDIFKSKMRAVELAKMYGVFITNIYAIKSGYSWSWLTGAPPKNTKKK